MKKQFLVPVDGSERSKLAAAEAIQLAKLMDAEITFLHVVDFPIAFVVEATVITAREIDEELEKAGKIILEKIQAKYANSGIATRVKMLEGNPGNEIIKEAKVGNYDLIIMARRGLGEIKGFLMGSVSNRVVIHADCSVYIVK